MLTVSKHLRLNQSPPTGPITEASSPLPVRVRVTWTIGTGTSPAQEHDGWAMAWTRREVLVWWRSADAGTSAWLRADQVTRR